MTKHGGSGRRAVADSDRRAFQRNLAAYVRDHFGGERKVFAERLGLGRKTVDRWFTAERMPDVAYLLVAARKVGWSLDGALLNRGRLQWVNTETKPADQVRAAVLAELVARTGLPEATLTLVVPTGTMLVRAMAAALGPDVATKLDLLRFVVEGWHFRDRDEWQPAVQHARNLAKQLGLPWDERLTTVEIPRRSGEKLQRLKAPRPLPFVRA